MTGKSSASFDFTDSKVFVFGGTSGINLGIAQCFAAAGATLAVASRNQDKVDSAVSKLSTDRAAYGYALDVRDAQAVATALSDFHQQAGEIDVLISGAAGNFPAPALGMSPNAFKSVVDIDLLGTFNVLHAGFEYLRKPGASVINISAPQSSVAMALQSHVCAAKAGVDQLTRSLAIEWGSVGVRVNAVIPGPIDGTEGMARLAPNEAARQAVIDSVPMRRYGAADEIGAACLWLSSDAAAFVSGALLPVDGGWLAAGVPVSMG